MGKVAEVGPRGDPARRVTWSQGRPLRRERSRDKSSLRQWDLLPVSRVGDEENLAPVCPGGVVEATFSFFSPCRSLTPL